MGPIFWLNLVLGIVIVGVMLWAVRRIDRQTAAIENLALSLREAKDSI